MSCASGAKIVLAICGLLAYTCVFAQTEPKLDDGKPVTLGEPTVKQDQAKAAAINVLRKLGIKPGKVSSTVYRLRPHRHGYFGSKWMFSFDSGYKVEVSGQSGRIVSITDTRQLERESRAVAAHIRLRMKRVYGPPPELLVAFPETSVLLDFEGNVVTSLKSSGGYNEVVRGTEKWGEPCSLMFTFSAVTGKLIGFTRTDDYTLGDLSQHFSAEQAMKAATAANSAHWPVKSVERVRQFKPTSRKAFILMPPNVTPGIFTNSLETGYVCWVISLWDREVWVNVNDGKIMRAWGLRRVGTVTP